MYRFTVPVEDAGTGYVMDLLNSTHRRIRMKSAFQLFNRLLITALALAFGAVLVRADAPPATTLLVSVPSTSGQTANEDCYHASASYDGSRVVFYCKYIDESTNLSSLPDTLNTWDVFLRDRTRNETIALSATYQNQLGQGNSMFPVISPDGQWVAFQTSAQLKSTDTDSRLDIYVVKVEPDGTVSQSIQASRRSAGTPANDDSGYTCPVPLPPGQTCDPKYLVLQPSLALYTESGNPRVIFQSDASNLDLSVTDGNNRRDLYVSLVDATTGNVTNKLLTRTASGGNINGDAWHPVVSYDGRWVAFTSDATNLVPGVSGIQVYLMDRDPDNDGTLDNTLPAYTLVSRAADGKPGNALSFYPAISADGVYIAFASDASNLETQNSAIPADTNGKHDVYLWDRLSGRTRLISARYHTDPDQALEEPSFSPTISADGRWIAFTSEAGNVVPEDVNVYCAYDEQQAKWVCSHRDLFIYDRLAGSDADRLFLLNVRNNPPSPPPEGTGEGMPVLLDTPPDPTNCPNPLQVCNTSAFPVIAGNRSLVTFSSQDRDLPDGEAFNVDERFDVWARVFDVPPPAPQLTYAPSRLSFYALPGQETAGKNIILTNFGDMPVTIGKISIGGRDDAYFQITADGCSNRTLDAAINGVPRSSGRCTLAVKAFILDGEEVGEFTARVIIPSDDPRMPEATVALWAGPRNVYLPAVLKP